jgi:endoglucanase
MRLPWHVSGGDTAFSPLRRAQTDRAAHLLEELSNAYGPSGFEGPVRVIVRRELTPLADRIETDGLGSLIAVLGRNADAPRVMIAAHMDELGMMVKHVTENGYVKFQTLGGWLDQGLINQRFVILTRKGEVRGVTGLKTPHVMAADERGRVTRRDDFFIDVGAVSRRMPRLLGIRPGTPSRLTAAAVLNGGPLYVGKAWDDRAGRRRHDEADARLKANPPAATVRHGNRAGRNQPARRAHPPTLKPEVGISRAA